MINADEAKRILFENASVQGPEEVPLQLSLGRFLHGPVYAPIGLPNFDHAAMDGFAVRSGDTTGAYRTRPLSLKVAGLLAAGHSPCHLDLKAREAVRIMTGAPVPSALDAVIPFEEVHEGPGSCEISRPVNPGENIRRASEDIHKGDPIFEGGERIHSRLIALLAALGLSRVKVCKRPRVGLLITGSEIVPVGEPLSPGKIYNSNGPALAACLEEIGLEPVRTLQVEDRKEALKEALLELRPMDYIITVGGVSRGDFDLIPAVLEEMDARILFHKVSMKPGKPFLAARLAGTLLFGLPGNPVSAWMIFHRFVRPILLKSMGARKFDTVRESAVAAEEFAGSPGRESCQSVFVEGRDGRYWVRSAGPQGSANLATLARADAVIRIPASQERVKVGERVDLEFLSEGK